MRKLLLLLSLSCGVVFGQKDVLSCVLEVTQSDQARKGTLLYHLKATLTYHGSKPKLVSKNDTFELIAMTKDGAEVAAVFQGADHYRRPVRSDFHKLQDGEKVTFLSGVIGYEKEGRWILSWEDSLGGVYTCKLETLAGVKLVMKYSNEAKEDVRLKLSETSTFVVLKKD
ncbi:MAG: hypothetical protein ACJAVK_003670, partial [Akkermansiaceae bacterium]